MNEKGMIVTSLLYAVLILFILVLFTIVLTIGIRKNMIENMAAGIEAEMDKVPPTISGPNVLYAFTGQPIAAENYNIGLTATDNLDEDVTASITCTKPATKILCTAIDSAGNLSADFEREIVTVSEIAYDKTDTYKVFVPVANGTYKIELWGAAGGSANAAQDGSGATVAGAPGAYVAGEVALTVGTSLYIYIGEQGDDGAQNVAGLGGYNGGGTGGNMYQGGAGGGGATDIRLVSGAWNNQQSLISRIMVAAGGAGTANGTDPVTTGFGGTINGGDGSLNTGAATHTVATGGMQNIGGLAGANSQPGLFGIGGNSNTSYGSGGGGGYYGGGGGGTDSGAISSAAGGSSFISGHTGCVAVTERGIPAGQTDHYSGIVFTNTEMKSGAEEMPTYDGLSTMTGNTEDGYIKITYISS